MKNTLIICLLLTLIVQACDQHGGPSSLGQSTDNQIEQKVDSILQLMTLKEKIDQISGVGFDTRPNERLGIPTLRMTDGPVGIRWDKATALPAAISLASSWDDSLMYQVGQLLGKEAKARGRNFFLGPCVNIHRFPIGGRNFESFGEDPYLAGRIAIPYIQGVQSENVLACVKHFACNNQEWNRDDVNAVVGERALH
ncbi:MAG: glycoside hydrolase family 3 N-terminal domain-containing protein, partial [Reichenbachiella sp.]